MEKEITQRKLIDVWNVMSTLLEITEDVKLHYNLAKNKRLFAEEIDPLLETQAAFKDIREYHREVAETRKELAFVDDKGEKVQINGVYIVSGENESKFNERIKELEEKYSEDIKKAKEFDKMTTEKTVKVKYFSIPLSLFPKKLEGTIIDILFDFIDGDK